jgi:hypothetical protein
MLARIAICVAATLGAGLLAAQTTLDFEDTVSRHRVHAYQVEVDHGPTPQQVDVTTSFTTGDESGLVFTMYDLDGLARLAPLGKRHSVHGPGTIATIWQLPVRSGIHQIMITLEVAVSSAGASSSYVGTMSVLKETLKLKEFQSRGPITGSRVWFGRIAQFTGAHRGKDTLGMDVELDFGPMAHSTTFAVTMSATGVTDHRLIDLKSDQLVMMRRASDSDPVIQGSYTYTTKPYAGRVKFRVEMKGSGDAGWITHSIATGPDVEIRGVSDPWEELDEEASDCAARGGSNHWPTIALAAPLAWAILRRRQRATNVRPGC